MGCPSLLIKIEFMPPQSNRSADLSDRAIAGRAPVHPAAQRSLGRRATLDQTDDGCPRPPRRPPAVATHHELPLFFYHVLSRFLRDYFDAEPFFPMRTPVRCRSACTPVLPRRGRLLPPDRDVADILSPEFLRLVMALHRTRHGAHEATQRFKELSTSPSFGESGWPWHCTLRGQPIQRKEPPCRSSS